MPSNDISISVVENISQSVTVDASKIKIECNQKAASDKEGTDKLLDKSNNTKWVVNFKPKDTNLKLSFSEPIELASYTFVLANDKPECDPIEWRVRIKESQSLNIYEEFHKIEDYSAKKCARGSTQEFKMRMRNPKKISEVTFHFDKLKDGNAKMMQICQINIYALGGVVSNVASKNTTTVT